MLGEIIRQRVRSLKRVEIDPVLKDKELDLWNEI
jgi:hypothetical protein